MSKERLEELDYLKKHKKESLIEDFEENGLQAPLYELDDLLESLDDTDMNDNDFDLELRENIVDTIPFKDLSDILGKGDYKILDQLLRPERELTDLFHFDFDSIKLQDKRKFNEDTDLDIDLDEFLDMGDNEVENQDKNEKKHKEVSEVKDAIEDELELDDEFNDLEDVLKSLDQI
jgi:hypothetical protein